MSVSEKTLPVYELKHFDRWRIYEVESAEFVWNLFGATDFVFSNSTSVVTAEHLFEVRIELLHS